MKINPTITNYYYGMLQHRERHKHCHNFPLI